MATPFEAASDSQLQERCKMIEILIAQPNRLRELDTILISKHPPSHPNRKNSSSYLKNEVLRIPQRAAARNFKLTKSALRVVEIFLKMSNSIQQDLDSLREKYDKLVLDNNKLLEEKEKGEVLEQMGQLVAMLHKGLVFFVYTNKNRRKAPRQLDGPKLGQSSNWSAYSDGLFLERILIARRLHIYPTAEQLKISFASEEHVNAIFKCRRATFHYEFMLALRKFKINPTVYEKITEFETWSKPHTGVESRYGPGEGTLGIDRDALKARFNVVYKLDEETDLVDTLFDYIETVQKSFWKGKKPWVPKYELDLNHQLQYELAPGYQVKYELITEKLRKEFEEL